MPKGRILAVDDQRYFRELIEGTLAEQGFEVRTASSGDEALAILEQSVFDVVITDLVMPVMNGTELVQRVKERDSEQDIVVVTGVVDVKSAVDAMRLGATDYLLKPYDRDMLVASLESILQRRRLSTERDRLLAENIEYLGERALFARALGLFSLCSRDALGEKVLEGLCEETGAQGGVLWLAACSGWPRKTAAARCSWPRPAGWCGSRRSASTSRPPSCTRLCAAGRPRSSSPTGRPATVRGRRSSSSCARAGTFRGCCA
jgi:CheY-like chemotaxis protein